MISIYRKHGAVEEKKKALADPDRILQGICIDIEAINEALRELNVD